MKPTCADDAWTSHLTLEGVIIVAISQFSIPIFHAGVATTAAVGIAIYFSRKKVDSTDGNTTVVATAVVADDKPAAANNAAAAGAEKKVDVSELTVEQRAEILFKLIDTSGDGNIAQKVHTSWSGVLLIIVLCWWLELHELCTGKLDPSFLFFVIRARFLTPHVMRVLLQFY